MANMTESICAGMVNESIPRDPFLPQQQSKKLDHTTSEVAHNILKECGLTSEEYTALSAFYDRNISALKQQNNPLHIRKTSLIAPLPPLPRSLVYVPNGKMKGMYILCKTKGGVKEIGLGRHNRATLMLHIDSGKKKVFRTTHIQYSSTLEVDANNAYIERDPEGKYFVAGIPVFYDGPWRSRTEYPRSLNQSTHLCPREENAKKIGFILNYIAQGELYYIIRPPLQDRLQTHDENIAICLHLLEGVAMSHQMGLVNLDNKPENIFMDGNTPKMGDFGSVVKTNEKLPLVYFSPPYSPPEILRLISKSIEPFNITPVHEMWSIGCILAHITKGPDFHYWLLKTNVNPKNLLNENVLKDAIKYCFPTHETKESLDYYIASCLRYIPEERISAEELVEGFKKIYYP